MEKKYYIQPKMDTMVLPKEVLMDAIGGGLAGSGGGPGVGEGTSNPAPKRVPTLGNDSVQVF